MNLSYVAIGVALSWIIPGVIFSIWAIRKINQEVRNPNPPQQSCPPSPSLLGLASAQADEIDLLKAKIEQRDADVHRLTAELATARRQAARQERLSQHEAAGVVSGWQNSKEREARKPRKPDPDKFPGARVVPRG